MSGGQADSTGRPPVCPRLAGHWTGPHGLWRTVIAAGVADPWVGSGRDRDSAAPNNSGLSSLATPESAHDIVRATIGGIKVCALP